MNDARLPLDDPAHGAFCKSCGKGFPAGTTWCVTCGRKLISREEAAARGAGTTDSDTMVLLQTFAARADAGWAGSALDARGIPSRLDAATPQLGAGAYLKARLFVAPEHLDEARSILAAADEPVPDLDAERDREEFSRARRVRYLRVILGFNAAWATFSAYVVVGRLGGVHGVVEVILACIWIFVFVFSFYRPRPAFASAMALGVVLLLLSVAASWAGPESREPFRVVLSQCLFVVFMHWGWLSSRAPDPV
jgi:hypothetical protein